MNRTDKKKIDDLVQAYRGHHAQIDLFHSQLLVALNNSTKLSASIHSIRSRLKDPDHLRDKLVRKWQRAGENFDVRPDNLLVAMNDLVGIRILHLYTRQIQEIDATLREILDENKFNLIEGPSARTWDDESRAFFQECNIGTQTSPSLYTSVHYVVESASRTKITAEIQVRTLMEEVWGEVDHQLNYPHATESLACREQLKVLARVTSSASRLVDAIFSTHKEHAADRRIAPPAMPQRPRRKRT